MLVILMCLVHQVYTIRVNYLRRYVLNAPGIIKLSARCMERLKSCWYFSSPRFTQVSANSEVTSHLIQSNINSREVGPAIGPELSLITSFQLVPQRQWQYQYHSVIKIGGRRNWTNYAFYHTAFPKTIPIHLISIDIFLFPAEPKLCCKTFHTITHLTM